MTAVTSRTSLSDHRALLLRALADPVRIGAVAPTGQAVAGRISAVVPGTGAPAVLELGGGTGALTRAIRDRMPPAGRLVVLESDPDLAAHLGRSFPGLDVSARDATELERALDAAGVGRVDAVVCSLPLTVMPDPARRRVLAAAARRLRPGGTFATVTYRTAWPPAARRLAADLNRLFAVLECTPTIWANVPPARLWLARDPRPC